jgi:hypothetical protein
MANYSRSSSDLPLTDAMRQELRRRGLHDFEFAGLTQGHYHRLRLHEAAQAADADPTGVPPREAAAQQIPAIDNTNTEKRPAFDERGAVVSNFNRQGIDVMDTAKVQANNASSTPVRDWAMTTTFLTTVDPTAGQFTFQFRNGPICRTHTSTADGIRPYIEQLNTSDCGFDVYVSVVTNGAGGRYARALIANANNREQVAVAAAAIKARGIMPGVVIGYVGRNQVLYFCSGVARNRFSVLQKRLGTQLGTDLADIDQPWVRLPGTLSFEDPARPRLVTPRKNGTAERWNPDNLLGKLEPLPGTASDIGTAKVTVTFFPNEKAQSLRCADLTLPQLAEEIRLETSPSKLTLPWLKLAVFGERRSPRNCLRTNNNTAAITGIEVEHDKGEIAFDIAIATMRTAKLRALLYTSPSYMPIAKERWRILLPLSGNMPPQARAIMVARVNGLFGGKLAPESFDLSRSYLYGCVNGNPAHRVEVTDGEFIDLRINLDQGAMGKSPTDKSAKPRPASRGEDRTAPVHGPGMADTFKKSLKSEDRFGAGIGDASGRTDVEIMALLELSRQEHEWHNAMLSATASMVGRGWTNDRIYKTCAPYGHCVKALICSRRNLVIPSSISNFITAALLPASTRA